MRDRIGIRTRRDEPEGESDSAVVRGTPVFVWAKVEPVGGALYFGLTQTETAITHRFYIRTGPEVTAQHVIEWKGHQFRVRRAEMLGDAQQYMMIESEDLGEVNNV